MVEREQVGEEVVVGQVGLPAAGGEDGGGGRSRKGKVY